MLSAGTFANRLNPDQYRQMSAWSGTKLFDTLMVYLKEFFKKVDFEKKTAKGKNVWKIFPGGKEWNQTLDSVHREYNLASTRDFGIYCTCAKPPLICACWVIVHASVVICWLFSKWTFSKNSFRNTIWVSNSLDLDQYPCSVRPDLGPNCLQRLSPDGKSGH